MGAFSLRRAKRYEQPSLLRRAHEFGQRWRAGIFDPRQDAIDGLTIIGALFGAAGWARGARVLVRGPSGETLARIFVGAQIGSDLVQGVLIAVAPVVGSARVASAGTAIDQALGLTATIAR